MSIVMVSVNGTDQPTMVEDMTGCTSHEGKGDVYFFHVMPVESADNPLGVLEKMDADPVAFWTYVADTQQDVQVPPQLLVTGSWVESYQAAAESDRASLISTCPVCRAVVVSISATGIMVKAATANHQCQL